MWVLSSQSDVFQGKRLWITPGSRHIIGRTQSKKSKSKDQDAVHGINHQSVSRKHLQLFVDPVAEGSSTDLDARSTLWLEESSKVGTWISENEEDFKEDINDTKLETGKKMQVTASKMYIKLGGWERFMLVEWVPISLAVTHIGKRHLDRGMKMVRDQLESFGVKLSPVLQGDSTTHVVCRSRNTPPVLEGLVRGKYIVSDSYIGALVTAMTPIADPGSTNMQSLKAPLEKDFDGNFPDPMEYVPAPGKEPQPRPSEFLKPEKKRSNMFEGVSFIFCEDDQQATLRTPIEVGKGKTKLYPGFTVGSTTAREFTAFVLDTANGQSSNSKTVVVRPPLNDEPGPTLEWKRSFLQQVDLILGQRSIVQNEFLDAILTSDIDALCQPLQDMSGPMASFTQAPPSQPLSAPAGTQSQTGQSQAVEERLDVEELTVLQPKVEQSPSKSSKSQKFRFTQAKSRFKGFDDFDSTAVPSISEAPQEPSQQVPEVANQDEEQVASEVEPPTGRSVKSNKRPADNPIETLLPTSTAVKRRRLHAGKGQDEDEVDQKVVEAKPSRVFRKRTIRPAKDDEADVMDAARAMREKEQEQTRLDEEMNDRPLEQDEVRRIREQIAVGELPIRVPLRGESANGRWDDQWNGRQNFKKFRRKGDGPQPIRGHRVIVRLEEAKKRDLALGAVRWAATGNLPDSPSTAMGAEDEYEDESQFRRRSRAFQEQESHHTSNESVVLEVEDSVLVASSRRLGGNAAAAATSVASSETRGTKRSATSRISPPAKRAGGRSQKARKAEESSEGTEDELRFKFSKRRGKAK